MYFLSNFCHLCLKDGDEDLIDLSKNEGNNSITATKLASCVSEVKWCTAKHLLVCRSCLERLEFAYEFKQMCLKSNIVLKRRLKSLRGKSNRPRGKLDVVLSRTPFSADLTKQFLEEQAREQLFLSDQSPKGYLNFILTNGQPQSYQNIFLNFVSTNNVMYPVVPNQSVTTNANNITLQSLLEPKKVEELSVDIDPSLYNFEHFLLGDQFSSNRSFDCEKCRISFLDLPSLETHSKKVHLGRLPHKCTFCFTKFLLKRDLDEHVKGHIEECDSFTTNTIDLTSVDKPRHVLGNYIQNHYNCKDCSEVFDSSEDLSTHMSEIHGVLEKPKLRKESDSIPCDICKVKFTSISSLLRHMKKHYKEERKKKKIKHDVCDIVTIDDDEDEKQLGDGKTVADESTVNMNHFKAFCNICQKAFAKPADLQRHSTRVHRPTAQYHCHLCPQTFYEGFLLTRHLQGHYSSFECVECKRTFATVSEVVTHVTSAHPDKPGVECNVCDANFTDLEALRAHAEDHLAKIFYKCHLCEAQYSTCRELTQHFPEHDRMNWCERCNRIFKSAEELVVHRGTCMEGSYRCQMCPRSFNEEKEMKLHVKSMHGENKTEVEAVPEKKRRLSETSVGIVV